MIALSLRAKIIGGVSVALILAAIGYCHHRDTEHVQQGVRQERVRVADSVITVTGTVFRRDTAWLAKALSHRDSQLIATRFELAKAINEKPADTLVSAPAGVAGISPLGDTSIAASRLPEPGQSASAATLTKVVTACNAQIASDSIALAAALSALHTCGESRDAWKAKALAGAPPAPSRVKPFVAGALAGVAALVAVIHFVK